MSYGAWVVVALVTAVTLRFDLDEPIVLPTAWEVGITTTTTTTTVYEDSFDEGDGMPQVAKWGRLYLTTSRGRAKVVLAIQRLKPRARGDATWTVVDNDRRVSTVTLGSRKVAYRRPGAGIEVEDFRPLNRQEKQDAEGMSREMVSKASTKKPKWARRLTLVSTPLMAMWGYSAMGTTGLFGLFVWRAAVYFEVPSMLRTCFEVARSMKEVFDDSADMMDYMEDSWADGSLDGLLFGVSTLAVCIFMWLSSRSAPPKPQEQGGESPSDSGSESGRSVGSSDADDLQNQMASLREQMAALRRTPPTTPRASSRATTPEAEAEPSPRKPPSPDDPGMRAAAATLLRRLEETERIIQLDMATKAATAATTRKPPDEPLPTPEPTSPNALADTQRLREMLRDPREKVIEQLETFSKDVDWQLPANVAERVAPHLLVQIFSDNTSVKEMAAKWIQAKQLERNHVAHEMMLLAMVLDTSLLNDKSFASSQSCEILCRRIYALKKAFESVRSVGDWRQPKGAASSKWKSKVRWDLANEIDLRSLSAEGESLPAVDKELQSRLRDKALLHRFVEGSPTGGHIEEEV